MDIGTLKNDFTYYRGFEDENEIVLCIEKEEAIHIWEGYFDDILENPSLDGKDWKGFTRDYHQLEGIFSGNDGVYEMNPEEYMVDLSLYKRKIFEFTETKDVLHLIISLFEKAIKLGVMVKAERA